MIREVKALSEMLPKEKEQKQEEELRRTLRERKEHRSMKIVAALHCPTSSACVGGPEEEAGVKGLTEEGGIRM